VLSDETQQVGAIQTPMTKSCSNRLGGQVLRPSEAVCKNGHQSQTRGRRQLSFRPVITPTQFNTMASR
jgi:hypothetical protein